MRLRHRATRQPEVLITPMIDVMFALVVFFMFSALYMVNLKTVGVNMPKAVNADLQNEVTCLVSMKRDGSLWLDDRRVDEQRLLADARREVGANPKFAVVIRADRDLGYGKVIALLDKLKGAGVVRFGLATEQKGEG